jgi:transposase-like protein
MEIATRPTCPNPACSTPHVVKNGHLAGRQRYHCRNCGRWFGETEGTPLYRLRTDPREIAVALNVLVHHGSLRAAEEITGHKYETIRRWAVLAVEQADLITTILVHDLQLTTVEVDEFWSFIKKKTASAARPTPRPLAATGAV